MRIIRTAAGMQRQAQAWQRAGRPVGFVPTMGYLHDGHLSLVRQARRRVGPQGIVVLSIYVNPTQFAPTEDLARYPRDWGRDRRLCQRSGVDVLFAPTDAQMYPGAAHGHYSTYVVEERLSQRMEGAARPTHFRGVSTIVAKLLNLVRPSVAVFGAKDFQQAAVVQRMARDLHFPVRILVAPTVREPDGLAMSSRNKYLSPTERVQATVLWQTIRLARSLVRRQARPLPVRHLRSRLARLVAAQPAARLDYLELFDPVTLVPVTLARPGVRLALAVFIGRTRLIDNASL